MERWRWKPLLRRSEQVFAGSIVLASSLIIVIASVGQRRSGDRPIDIEQPHQRTPVQFQLDVNRAGAAELGLLPGVGDTLARRMIESRRRDGPFTTPDDLLRVPGIGPKTLKQIEPFLLPLKAQLPRGRKSTPDKHEPTAKTTMSP